MPVHAAVIARDYSVVSSGWLKNTGMHSRQRRNLLVSCTGLQGTGSFVLFCLVFDLEGYDALLGSDAVAYYRELCCMSFSAQDVCAQPMFKSQSLLLEVCGGTTCSQQHLYVNYLVEHSIAGMCTSKNGPLSELLNVADAHGIPLTLQQHHIKDVKNIISNHVFQGLCADPLYLPLSQILVGCLDYLQELVFADKIRKQNIPLLNF
ncbi:hypothetical protein IW262DRAFT_1401364 [Armillaria fumosa]|nr:hypothetical protein IW262DRAFT_1401364 [Armillaria fumosa]